MTVWMLLTEFPPFYDGGIATYGYHAATLYTQQGHTVTVFVADDHLSQPIAITHTHQIRVIRFRPHHGPPENNLGPEAYLSWRYATVCEEFLRQEGAPDVIETQDYLGIAYFVLQRRYTLDPLWKTIPVVIVAHAPKFLLSELAFEPHYTFPHYWIEEMERFCYRAADAVIAPSQFMAQVLRDALPGLNPIVIAHPYIRASDDVVAPGSVDGPLHFLYIGRLQWSKGIMFLLDALEKITYERSQIVIDIIGRDILYPPTGETMITELKRRHPKLWQSHVVHFWGPQTRSRIAEHLHRATAVIVPSLFESFSYVVAEAMDHGKIVIASDQGGQRELVTPDETGFLYAARDTHHLARLIDHVATLSQTTRRNMGETAQLSLNAMCGPRQTYTPRAALWAQVAQHHPSPVFPFIHPNLSHADPPAGARMLSVIIPYYNLGQYVLDTLASLEPIVYTLDTEVLLIDDGSTDGLSVAQLYRIPQHYPWVTIHREPNRGLAATRNLGAQRAHGTYLAFLDADDRVHPTYYARALDILQYFANVSFVGCWVQYFGTLEQIWPTWNPEPPYILYHNTVNSSALVYRRDHFLEAGQNDPTIRFGMEDYESVIRLTAAGCRGVVIPEVLFYYRIRPESMYRTLSSDMMKIIYQQIMEKNSGFYEQYALDLFNLFNSNGAQYVMDNPSWTHPWQQKHS